MPNGDLQSKRALVVGGSGGIGKAVSRLLCERGAQLWLHGSSEESAARAATRLGEELGAAVGTRIHPIGRHIETENDWDDIVERVREIDICVVCFGPYLERPLLETDAAEWRRLYELNVVFPAQLVAAALPGMKRRDFGRLVLFGGTGTHSVHGFREIAAYSAAKTALGVLVRSAALEIGAENVTINAICPGMVDTEYMDDSRRRRWGSRMPTGQLMRPERIAAAVGYLLEPGNRDVNGVLLPVDEGLTAR